MKKNTIMYIFIIILIILSIGLYWYKDTIYKEKKNNTIDKLGSFYEYEIENSTKVKKSSAVNNKYLDYVVDEDVKHYDIDFIYQNSNVYGYIEIDENSNIIIYDKKSNAKKIFNDDQFKSLYIPYFGEEKSISVIYALSNNGQLYCIVIPNGDIKETKIYVMNKGYKVSKFTELKEYNLFEYNNYNAIIVKTTGEVYDFNIDMPYDENNTIIGSEYIIYSDGSITTYDGKYIKNMDSKNYYLKYAIRVSGNNFNGTDILLITTDNHLIYAKGSKLYTYNLLIKNIELVDDSNCKITFDNDKSIIVKCSFDKNRYNLGKID